MSYVPIEAEEVRDLLSEIENAIVQQIAQLEDYGLDILNTPKPPRVNHKGQALVYFSGSSDDRPGADGKTSKAELSFTINLQLADQRSHQKAYPFVMSVRQLLQGFRPEVGNTGRLFMKGVTYEAYNEGDRFAWVYNMIFSVQVLY